MNDLKKGKRICFELSHEFKFKKQLLYKIAKQNNIQISYVINKSVDYLLKDNENDLNTIKCQTAFKLNIPVLKIDFLLNYNQESITDTTIKQYIIKNNKIQDNFNKGIIKPFANNSVKEINDIKASKLIDLAKLKFYELNQDPLISLFESNGYNIIKWSVFNVQYTYIQEKFRFWRGTRHASFWHHMSVNIHGYGHAPTTKLSFVI